eukprot:TRINITY_DN2229_c0_g1_i9.p1 TRINITY_DN2229_c0_g1~~TRINITY_DN2229_c0_g1_i9.p1  ORF type:complete len:372 (+),score=48.35 TRINITY_DN2229_c0_g1_i9:163-1278(+)
MIREIKKKARVFIKDGVLLMGVMDEYGVLKQDEVFFQLCKDGETTVGSGTVVITKNPCFHPGDVRKFTAVNHPKLSHLRNCLVFPQTSSRPHPNEMSGSDLDGDLYFVTWDKRLIFDGPNRDAMDFTAPVAPVKHGPHIDAVKQFFLDFIQNDILGIVANTHLICADRHSLGVASKECIELAKLHSIAVDFAKSGVPAKRPDIIFHKAPDFMERPNKDKYESTKALGYMYRSIAEKPWKEMNHEYKAPQLDRRLEVDGYEGYIKEAREMMRAFNRELKFILRTFGVRSEMEVVSGNIVKCFIGSRTRRNSHDIKEPVTKAMNQLRNEYIGYFGEEDNLAKAYAWYRVAYEQKKPRFLSFAWLKQDLLLSRL